MIFVCVSVSRAGSFVFLFFCFLWFLRSSLCIKTLSFGKASQFSVVNWCICLLPKENNNNNAGPTNKKIDENQSLSYLYMYIYSYIRIFSPLFIYYVVYTRSRRLRFLPEPRPGNTMEIIYTYTARTRAVHRYIYIYMYIICDAMVFAIHRLVYVCECTCGWDISTRRI